MMFGKEKKCTDCKHSNKSNHSRILLCNRPNLRTGILRDDFCSIERRFALPFEDQCGWGGKYFERRED